MNQRQQVLSDLESLLQQMISTTLGRRQFLAASSLLLSACASTERTRYREGDNAGQEVNLSPADERRLTAEVLPQMRKDYPPVNQVSLQNYVSSLGRKLVAANQLEGRPYQYSFSVVDVPFVNAFALPAGTIFVTAPLIEMAESEAELIGVIGHEVGHVKARHAAERMAKAEREKSKNWLFAVGGGLVGAAAGFGLGKLACPPKDQKCLQKAVELGGVAGVGGGLLIQKYQFMANSREDEMEADRIGFRTSVNCGYDPVHCGLFYEKLLKMERESKRKNIPLLSSVQDAMSTHPPSEERVQQMKQMAAETKKAPNAVVNTIEFDRMKKIAGEISRRAKERGQNRG